ncbi:MAG TPA: GspE/PulE family protein [Candidatus Paceibacterota bacterium]|nr:GspE/PulE family protein [Candidatus Paceibacterota bacterium]
MNLLALLFEEGKLSAADRLAIERSMAEEKKPLSAALAEHGLSLEDALAAAGTQYGLPARTLGDAPIDEAGLAYIPEESARHYKFAPLGVEEGALAVGIVDPDNIEALDALQFISGKIGMPYKAYLIAPEDFAKVLEAYRNLSGEVGKALTEFETTAEREPAQRAVLPLIDSATAVDLGPETMKEDAPVTKIVSTILRYAIEGGASDIHIEPTPGKTRVRFRMDGDLHTSLELPAKVHDAIVARIKVLAQLRLDERRKPQDGRFSAVVEKRRIDFRVSTFPTEYGEKVVMRILDRSKQAATLETIGLSSEQLAGIREMLKAPYGIVLIAGPTGSGKSTTLFAMLSELDREAQNVVSLEDPVEYEIEGVAQSQVRPEIGYDFASGLRSILRQDPDVIMVGEIRDKETAALAVQAALTGHLVFSTIHTNTAAGAIPRLVDMQVDPYLIAPTLIAVIGQRLVRKLCPGGGQEFAVTESLKGLLDTEFADLPAEYRKALPPFTTLYHAIPTPECPNGTRGRMGVFEILKMSKSIEHTLLTHPVEEEIYADARKEGMFTMREDAIIKALSGQIPFEEVGTLGGAFASEES